MKNRTLKITAFSVIAVLLVAVIAATTFIAAPAKSATYTYTADEAYAAAKTYSNQYITYQTRTLVSAHRAGGALAPENTLAAFELCLNPDTDGDGINDYAVDILEFDLHITKDNKLVLLHDDTFDRTSDCVAVFGQSDVKPRDWTLADLKELNLGENFQDANGDYPYRHYGQNGEPVPAKLQVVTLDEVLAYTEGEAIGLRYIIEIKDSGDAGRRATDILYDTMSRYNILSRTVVGTFNGDVSDYIDAKYGGQITRSAGIFEVLRIFFCYLMKRDLGNVKYQVLQIPYVSYFPFLGSAGFISYAHKYNIACQFWTINEASKMETLIANGADCIITDNPEIGYKVCNKVA